MSSAPLFTALPSRESYGYSCKIWLAYQLEKQYLGGTYYVWFTRELNPIENGDSSNPLEMYGAMDRAVKRQDENHPKVKDFRAGLITLVNRMVGRHNPAVARVLRRAILRAAIELFRPQLWRIDLERIAASRIRTDKSRAGWDEQYIPDLTEQEFEIIVQ
jgi:hypothetical protein